MNLMGPPEAPTLEELHEWCKEAYEFLKHPVFHTMEVGSVPDGNYTTFANDGELTQAGTARVQQRMWVSAGAIRGVGAAPATETLNPTGFIILEFADAADDYAQANLAIPAEADLSADMIFCVGWSVPNTSAAMTWGYGYLVTAANDDTEAAATTGTQAVASSSTADGLNVDTLFTIAGGTLGASDLCLHVYIYRDVSADAYGAVVDLHGMSLVYTAKKLGTAT